MGWLLSNLLSPSVAANNSSFNKSNSALWWVAHRTVNTIAHNGTGDWYFDCDLTASRGWSGTSESIGSDTEFSLLPPYSVAYCFKRVL